MLKARNLKEAQTRADAALGLYDELIAATFSNTRFASYQIEKMTLRKGIEKTSKLIKEQPIANFGFLKGPDSRAEAQKLAEALALVRDTQRELRAYENAAKRQKERESRDDDMGR